MAEIASVETGSIAEELGVEPGDILVSIDGAPVKDFLDYRFKTHGEDVVIQIEKPDGELWELEIEKDSPEDLGLEFKNPLLSEKLTCRNKCVFCFVDQQPKGLRPTLYFKDDDPRLSFIHGNYVTLTNIGIEEAKRLAGYRLSPLKISVHAADMALRQKMMGSEEASKLFEVLRIFSDAGIEMHFQIVLCKGLNDGAQLENTIEKLLILGARGKSNSLAVVPVGLTKYRHGLFPLEAFSQADAIDVISIVNEWQKKALPRIGSRFVFPADEWYIIAGKELPPYDDYEDFPQLDNGVGMSRLFEYEFLGAAKAGGIKKPLTGEVGIITGCAAKLLMDNLAMQFQEIHPNVKLSVYIIGNDFFGESVTVSGLLTGKDIINKLQGKRLPRVLFLPANAFKHGEEVMLDGTKLADLSEALGVNVLIGSADGAMFYKELAGQVQS